jgi:hypothetical protein
MGVGAWISSSKLLGGGPSRGVSGRQGRVGSSRCQVSGWVMICDECRRELSEAGYMSDYKPIPQHILDEGESNPTHSAQLGTPLTPRRPRQDHPLLRRIRPRRVRLQQGRVQAVLRRARGGRGETHRRQDVQVCGAQGGVPVHGGW